jgi:hypothetical protein
MYNKTVKDKLTQLAESYRMVYKVIALALPLIEILISGHPYHPLLWGGGGGGGYRILILGEMTSLIMPFHWTKYEPKLNFIVLWVVRFLQTLNLNFIPQKTPFFAYLVFWTCSPYFSTKRT